jgi:type VI protein secretion system component VasK
VEQIKSTSLLEHSADLVLILGFIITCLGSWIVWQLKQWAKNLAHSIQDFRKDLADLKTKIDLDMGALKERLGKVEVYVERLIKKENNK